MIEINQTQNRANQDFFKTQNETRQKEIDSIKKDLAEMQSKSFENNYNRITGISNRLNSGSKLSAGELSYLRENSPELYAKALKALKARNALRQKLRLCKTKGQVLALRTEVTQAAIIPNSANQVTTSQPQGCMTTQTGVDAYSYHATDQEWNRFKNSKRFFQLPYCTKNTLIKIKKKR